MSASPGMLTILHSVSQKHAAKQIRRHLKTGKVTNRSYGNEKFFRVEERLVGTFAELCDTLAALSKLPFAFPIRGAPLPDINQHYCRRLLHADKGDPATFREVPRRWFLVDVDHIPTPALTDPVTDPEDAVEHVIGLLPPELTDVSCFWQWSSSQSLPIPGEQDTLSLHLWYLSAVPLTGAELTRWTVAHNLAVGTRLIDPAAHRAVQPLYTSAPLFFGMTDPLPQRCGIRQGLEDEAVLVVPPADPRNPERASGTGYEPGLGVAAYLAKIGGAEGVRQPILSAIASYIAIHGSEADCKPLKKAIRQAVEKADLPGYSDEILERYKSDKHLDDIIAWVHRIHGDQAPKPPRPPPDFDETARILSEFNTNYTVIVEVGKVMVARWQRDPVLQRETLERMSFEDFKKLYANRTVAVITKDNNGEEQVERRNVAAWWLQHPQRRQFLDGVVFDPSGQAPASYLNLWRGFSVTPAPGDWSLMKDHIGRIICGGDPALAEYVLSWIALLFQHPENVGEVALVLRGAKGSGKGFLGRWIVRAFGHHGMQIAHAGHLTGRFNKHLHDCCFLFADEAFYAGDKQGEAVLKALITEPTIAIEGKFKDVVVVPNLLHLLIASNNEWVVPATVDERRFAALDVLDTRIGDRAYFAAISEQMENGGLAAMLQELLHRDLSGFEVRDIPDTAALRAQKTLSLSSLDRWWLTVLDRGYLYRSRHGAPLFEEWHEFYSTELLTNAYLQWCDDNRPYDRKSREQLGTFVGSLYWRSRPRGEYPVHESDTIDRSETHEIVSKSGTVLSPGRSLDEVAIVFMDRPHGYRVGDLEEARDRFAEMRPGVDLPWSGSHES